MNGEHNKKESPEVNGVRSSIWSNVWGPDTLPELTWCYNRNRRELSGWRSGFDCCM